MHHLSTKKSHARLVIRDTSQKRLQLIPKKCQPSDVALKPTTNTILEVAPIMLMNDQIQEHSGGFTKYMQQSASGRLNYGLPASNVQTRWH